MDSTFRELFYNHDGRLIHKWDHYFEIYEKYLSKYKGKKINILEIGISHGGSLQLLKKYFGDQVTIYAIDINPECQQFEENSTKIFIGSQSDPVFLQKVISQLPPLDVVIDDGGHTMIQQKVSFEMLYPIVKEGGFYLIEDTHTSYWNEFGGGLKKAESFVEYSKNFIDSLYIDHIHSGRRPLENKITEHINSISFYDSIIVFEKQKRPKPFHIRKGNETIATPEPENKKESLLKRIKSNIFGQEVHSFERNNKGKI